MRTTTMFPKQDERRRRAETVELGQNVVDALDNEATDHGVLRKLEITTRAEEAYWRAARGRR